MPGEDRQAARDRVVALTNHQAEVLEETTAAVARLLSGVDRTIEQAEQSMALAGRGRTLATEGGAAVGELAQTVGKLEQVLDELRRAGEVVQSIQACSKQIGEVVRESRVLAVNASIEAARAGPAGRGFAVVAEAVQDLSRFSGKMAEAISASVAQGIETLGSAADLVGEHLEESRVRASTAERTLSALGTEMEAIAEASEVILGSSAEQRGELEAIKTMVVKRSEAASYETAELVGLVTGVMIQELSPKEAASCLDSFRIIDVRRREEFTDELGHIQSAELHTIGPALERLLPTLDPEEPTLFVCRSGGRSARACQLAVSHGIRQVYNLEGGMLAWRKLQLPSVGRRAA